MDDCYFIDPGCSLESVERTSTQVTRRANRKKCLTVLYIVEHPNQEGDTCIDWTSQYCWTNGWNCLWRGHSVYRNQPLIPPPSPLQNPPKWAFGSTLCPQNTKKQPKRKCCVAKKKQVMQNKETKNTDPIRTTHPRPNPPNHPHPPFKTDQNELLASFCARKNHGGGGGRARSLYATPPPPRVCGGWVVGAS